MNTPEQIYQRLASLNDQRERLTGEVALIDGVIAFWEQQLEQMKEGENPTDPDVFREMFGPGATPTVPEVSYTYTDTPMAEEYYGG